MCSTNIYTCIMTMDPNFTIFCILSIFIARFFLTNVKKFGILYDFCCLFVNNFIFISLKNSQNFFMQSLPLHTSCSFSELLDNDIVDIEKPDGICLLTVVNFQDCFFVNQPFLSKIQDLLR